MISIGFLNKKFYIVLVHEYNHKIPFQCFISINKLSWQLHLISLHPVCSYWDTSAFEYRCAFNHKSSPRTSSWPVLQAILQQFFAKSLREKKINCVNFLILRRARYFEICQDFHWLMLPLFVIWRQSSLKKLWLFSWHKGNTTAAEKRINWRARRETIKTCI